MNFLVIGQGGREHAIVRALRQSPSVGDIHALPGSDGMAFEAECHAHSWQSMDRVAKIVAAAAIDVVVVGPEVPLEGGISDFLRSKGGLVFGPSREAARLESSKIFAKKFLHEAGIPTARFKQVSSLSDVQREACSFSPPYVLKADGLAAGKGVFVCSSLEELETSARWLFEEKGLGSAGAQAILEEFQPGWEVSCLVLTNGDDFEPLIMAQDHKRLLDGGHGPNTGGMGVVAPLVLDAPLKQSIHTRIIQPVIDHLRSKKLSYRGVLYIGLMITNDGPTVLEFNVRFGDPEAQVIMPLLDGDWADVFRRVAAGDVPKLRWKNQACACVVLAAEGYPDAPVKGAVIEGDTCAKSETSYFLHAGTKRLVTESHIAKPLGKENWVTSGGRVLNAIGIASTSEAAIQNAYQLARTVHWKGIQMRTDIGLSSQ